jgi:hypothetical protein
VQRVSLDGGPPLKMLDRSMVAGAYSPDGRQIALFTWEQNSDTLPGWQSSVPKVDSPRNSLRSHPPE